MKLLNLASEKSFWRGIDYHHEHRVLTCMELAPGHYQGTVKGSQDSVYDVIIDLAHPKRSTCNCPFADGRRVICKHMIALDLHVFPEKEQMFMDYIEEQNELYEEDEDYDDYEMGPEDIIEYVMSLSKDELRDELITRMMSELYEKN